MQHTAGTLIVSFFRNHLASEKNLSSNTLSSYSDCIRLLLDYACERLQITFDKLAMDAINEELILDFLDSLESQRDNVPQTRNQRLGAIKTFFRFLARQEPNLTAACERVCAIRPKKTEDKLYTTLEKDEVDTILQNPDTTTLQGARDAALLSTLCCTGARVQELVDLNINDLRLDNCRQITLTGKGNQQRIVPIWEETAKLISHYLELRKLQGTDESALFLNAKGQRITRFGINYIIKEHVKSTSKLCPSLKNKHVTAHTFRHTVALHLVQAGEDIFKIKDLLGHADINTTNKYVDISIDMKREAIQKTAPEVSSNLPDGEDDLPQWHKPPVFNFLKQLSEKAALC